MLLALILVLGVPEAGLFFVTTKLDVNKAQQGVQLRPTRPTVTAPRTSRTSVTRTARIRRSRRAIPSICEVSIHGTKRQVTVTFQDDKGTYEVGLPK